MIALASDHGGYELKQKVIGYLEANGYTCHDFGCYSLESCDYPEFGRAAAEAVAKGECEKGIVICGTGAGVSRYWYFDRCQQGSRYPLRTLRRHLFRKNDKRA